MKLTFLQRFLIKKAFGREWVEPIEKFLSLFDTPKQAMGSVSQVEDRPFQARVTEWMIECFGSHISFDTVERNHRFLEESLELVQSLGCSREDCRKLVEYVYDRPAGEPIQEVGGVMVTVAALCNAAGLDLDSGAETELSRVWTKIEKIRAKQAAKPRGSALPQSPSYRLAPEPPIEHRPGGVGHQYQWDTGVPRVSTLDLEPMEIPGMPDVLRPIPSLPVGSHVIASFVADRRLTDEEQKQANEAMRRFLAEGNR